ncbi:MAG TPA: hypothetical protein VHE81_00400 [Lacipirellulaceae bacterium]|nr:hypothetical protein [Lacipirellulaceae bacterium]
MIVLSYGMTKSGSTLAFELCKAILEKSGFPQRRLPDGVVAPGRRINFLEPVTLETIGRLSSEVGSKEIIAVKLHEGGSAQVRKAVAQEIERGNVRLHVNYRDLREVALSLIDAGEKARKNGQHAFSEFHRLEDTYTDIGRQLEICRRWGSVRGALHLFYNEVGFDTATAVQRICENIGLPTLDPQATGEVIDAVFDRAFTQKNKAVKDRYKDLTIRQSENLLDSIPGAKPFVNRVCSRGDLSWFNREPAGDAS